MVTENQTDWMSLIKKVLRRRLESSGFDEVFIDASLAERMNLPVELGEEYKIKGVWEGEDVKLSVVNPEGYEYFEDDTVKAPEGIIEPEPTYRPEVLEEFGEVFPTFERPVLESMLGKLETDEQFQDDFLNVIQGMGRTEKTEALLKSLGADDAYINELFESYKFKAFGQELIFRRPDWWSTDFWLENFFKPYGGKDLKGKAGASFLAGIGDMISTTAGTARWLGYEDVGGVLSAIGEPLQRLAPPDISGEFEVADLLDPEFYATKVTRTLPFAMSLAPLAIGGFYGGATVATAIGIGRIGAWIIGGLASAALSRPAESALEAGSAYDDAIARGKTEKEAQDEAKEVFTNNMKLAGADAWEIAIALAPTPKWVPTQLVKSNLVRTIRIGGKMVIVGLSEGGEEVYQDMITRHAAGEDWHLDPVSKEVFAIGMVMGAGMGLGGDVITSIVDKSKGKMTPELSREYIEAVNRFELDGFTREQAEFRALESIAGRPEGEKIISETIKEVKEETEKAEAVTPEPTIAPEAAVTPTEIPKAEVIPPKPPEVPPTAPVPPVPPPPGGASREIYDRIQFEPEQEGFIDKIRRGWHKFNVKMVDDLFAIKKVTDRLKKGGVELSIEENPYLMARLLRGITGKSNVFLETGTFGKQFWKMEKGKAKPNYTSEPLESILQEVKEPEKWRDFSTYLVAKRSVELSQRNIETGITREKAEASIGEMEVKYPKFSDLAERVYKYQDNLLVYANEMGLISKDLLGKLRQYGNYVPFYRVFNELQAKGLMGKKMANIAQPIKRIKGSEREILNPLESIVKNTYVIINSADRNQIGIMLANLADKYPQVTEVFERVKTPMARVAGVTAKELGVELEGLSDADAEAVVDIFRPSFYVRGDEVTVLIDGKKKYFRIDSDLRDALLNLDRESIGMLGKLLGAPARWLRAGATLSPDFMARNPIRDQMTAFAYSNYGFLPGIDVLRGLASVIAKDSDYQLFRASGAEHSMLVSMDRQYLQKSFKELVEGRRFMFYVTHPMELFRIGSELGEKATRLGEFKAGIRRGAIPLEAGYSARSVTLDFSQMGTTARAINTLIAFFNANLRGWGKMISSFKEHPVRTSAKVFMGITLPSILLYLANRDDDRWKEIPQWQKDLFWIVMTPDTIYRIPKPFELGIIFGSMPERFMEWLDNKDPELFKEALANLAEAGSPGYIPTAGLPIIEWMTNYSFFRGYSIVPASREKMPPELQYTAWTSEVSKNLGELLKLPPAKIDNMINGWTAGLGRYAVDIVDGILKRTGISSDIPEPSPTLADTPVIKAFVVRNPYGSSGETVERFYDTIEEYQKGEQYLKEMLKLGEQEKFEKYKAKHPELLFFYEFPEDPEKEGIFYSASARYLRRVSRDLSELSKKQDEIYKAKDINSERKRELIDEIDKLKTDVARKALNLLTGGEPQVLQDMINESVGRLGEVIEEPPVLSLEKPDIYTTKKLHADFGNILEAVTTETLPEGLDILATAYLEVKQTEKTVDPIPNKKIYEITPDLREGFTFEMYYSGWKQGLIEDETLDNLTRRQVDLLNEYYKRDKPGQVTLLEEHPELKINPRIEWLKSHPKENAQLAIWGQAKILTKEAYSEFNRQVKELDIPDTALPELTLPPEGSVDNYFKYQDMIEERSANSWEAQLLMIQDNELREWLEREPIETPVESLELKIKHRDLFDLRDSTGDKDSPNYIEDDDARKEALDKLKTDNPEWVDDMRRIEAIEHEGMDYQEQWVERGKLVDEFTAGSSEAKVWLLDNPEAQRWALEQEILTDDGSDWNEPVLRLNAKWREQDTEYNGYGDEKSEYYIKDEIERQIARDKLLVANEDYRKDRRRRDAYRLESPEGELFPEVLIPSYVDYYELPIEGFRQERYLSENRDFADAMHRIKGIDLPDFEKIPDVKYDEIYESWQPQFKQLEGLSDHESEYYIEDNYTKDPKTGRTPREQAAYDLRFDKLGKLTKFGIAEIRRQGYGRLIPENYIQPYVDYYTMVKEGRPDYWPDDIRWHEDDWWLMENQDFYQNVYLNSDYWDKPHERKDWTETPRPEYRGFYTNEVFQLYEIWENIPSTMPKQRKEMEASYPQLDMLLHLEFGTKLETEEPAEGKTVWERYAEIIEDIEDLLEVFR